MLFPNFPVPKYLIPQFIGMQLLIHAGSLINHF